MSIIEDKRSRPFFDFWLLIVTYLLMMMGVLAISVATFDPSVSLDLPLLNRILASSTGSWQAIFVVASPAAVWFIVSVPYEHFKTFSPVYFLATTILLLVVMVTASAIRGVQAWIQFEQLGRMLQPSEFAKITLILMLAKEFSLPEKPLGSLRSLLRVGTFVLFPAALTYLSNETGSVLIMLGIAYLMLYFGGADWKWMLVITTVVLLGVAAIFAYGIIGGSNDFRLMRILAFLDPHAYSLDAGLQLLRSQEAIGSGGLTGVGLFVPGSMSQLNFIPEDWTDFIFATIGEAVGFVGTLIIVLLFAFLIFRMLYLSRFTYDKFGRLVIIGVMSMMFLHVFQNVAMTIGLMPITGIPLPFLSYGGSNLLTNVIGISLVLNVTRNRTASMPSYNLPAGNLLRTRRRRRKAPIYVNTSQDRGLVGLRPRRRGGRRRAEG
ncbi:MAG: rod shape-determining protein RodA [Clostridiales bacterium]|mgnify:CR=1 FL=1|nr:rod shape-determining protein RodA [Clostridiales bacterium]